MQRTKMRTTYRIAALTFLFLLLPSISFATHIHETESASFSSSSSSPPSLACDIVIAGGSTAALGAAITAARHGSEYQVCLFEPTNWPGGQMTASAVSAIDFGPQNRHIENQAHDFAYFMSKLDASSTYCWVSYECYLPHDILSRAIFPLLSSLSNLQVYYDTVIKKVETKQNAITSMTFIHRMPLNNTTGYEQTLSNVLSDWYSMTDSPLYAKQIYHVNAKVFIEGTEWGEVLALSGAHYAQGIEYPGETSSTTFETCGQTTVYPFYITYESVPTPPSFPSVIPNVPAGLQNYSMDNDSWESIWSYRRVYVPLNERNTDRYRTDRLQSGDAPEPPPLSAPRQISNQNWGMPPGNDYAFGYPYLPRTLTDAQLNDWQGGINVTTLWAAELVSYGWFTYFTSQAPNGVSPYLLLDGTLTDTGHGLSKVPYMRESRRSIGIHSYQLTYAELQVGTVFPDRIAIGDYLYADVHRSFVCAATYPEYLDDKDLQPFTIPFRALTNIDFGNLLVVGKTIAQTFHANGGTRLHPVEYSTGVAGGVSAVYVLRYGTDTTTIYTKFLDQLQNDIRKYAPLEWTWFPDAKSI